MTHIRLVSPAGPPGPGRVARIQQCLAALGFDVSVGRHADAHHGFLAASDDARLHDLHAAFGDPDVDVVLAARGGYGTQRLLDQLDRDLVARSEVLFVGFSDLTALHVVLNQECGRRSVYAPAPDWGVGDPASTAATSFLTAVGDPASWTVHSDATEPTSSLTRGGSVTGPLVGGNLTLLASAAGTRDALKAPPGSVLLLEDVREAPYRLDRSLLQLARSGALDDVAGLALGQFVACRGREDGADALEVLSDWCDRLAVPVLGGLPIGHGPRSASAPLGITVRINDAGQPMACAVPE